METSQNVNGNPIHFLMQNFTHKKQITDIFYQYNTFKYFDSLVFKIISY